METEEIMNDTESATDKVARRRSPAWPFIPLPKAIERVREFYKAHREKSATPSAANISWGMKPKSGAGGQTIGTLKQYGLMREADSGGVVLTDLGLRIVRDQREVSPERDSLIRQAAMTPKIFADVGEKWEDDLPSDADVEYYLVQERGFNEESAKALLANYKATIRFAKVLKSDNLVRDGDSNGGDDGQQDEKDPPPPNPPIPPSTRLMEGERELTTGILSKTAKFRLIVSGEVGQKEIERLIAKLELDKEILADEPSGESSKNEPMAIPLQPAARRFLTEDESEPSDTDSDK